MVRQDTDKTQTRQARQTRQTRQTRHTDRQKPEPKSGARVGLVNQSGWPLAGRESGKEGTFFPLLLPPAVDDTRSARQANTASGGPEWWLFPGSGEGSPNSVLPLIGICHHNGNLQEAPTPARGSGGFSTPLPGWI